MLVRGAGTGIDRQGGIFRAAGFSLRGPARAKAHGLLVRLSFATITAGCRAGAATTVMIASGAILAALAPHSHHPMLIAAAGLVPLFILARIGRVGVALVGGALWGVSVATTMAALAAYTPAVEQSAATELASSNLLVMVMAPALFASFGAWLTRRFGFSPFVLGVTWYAIECGSAALGQTITAREYLVLEGVWYHSVATALGYTFLALLISWLTGTVVSVLDATVRAVFAARFRIIIEEHGGLLLRSLDEILSLQFFIPSLAPRAPPMVFIS
jgi:hypothetical protein